jgi:histidyl-tRNA synthetase
MKVPFKKNHRLVRGLDYYTRTVFEIQPRVEWGAQSALGGGGRYDGLIEELGGKPTPAIGFAVGMERIVINLKEQGIEPLEEPSRGLFIAYTGDGAKAEAVRFAAELRRCGLLVYSSFGRTSLRSQLRQANVLGAEYAFIFGEDELNKGTVTYRDMETGEQWEVALDEVMDLLAEG